MPSPSISPMTLPPAASATVQSIGNSGNTSMPASVRFPNVTCESCTLNHRCQQDASNVNSSLTKQPRRDAQVRIPHPQGQACYHYKRKRENSWDSIEPCPQQSGTRFLSIPSTPWSMHVSCISLMLLMPTEAKLHFYSPRPQNLSLYHIP